jgi:beta-lactamase superfamily II metal-dependent hydrolase
MFRLTMHQASEGDALVLAWGDEADPHHAVVDLGRTADYARLRPWLAQTGRVDLFAISHIDADHIAGAMPLVREAAAPFAPADVWFNGYPQLAAAKARSAPLQALSVAQGDKLERGIARFGWPWNRAFGGGPVSTSGAAPVVLPGGLTLTLLSPSDKELGALEAEWNKWLRRTLMRTDDPDAEQAAPAGLEPLSVLDVRALAAEPFREDTEAPNGSSIAFLAEFGGRRVMMGADAHPSCVARALRSLGFGPQNRLKLDLFKLCHHGSKGNLSPDLVAMLDCTRFAISTDGTRHNHPDPQSIARLLAADPDRPKQFHFNTRQPNAERWDSAALRAEWNYTCVFPPPPLTAGLTVDI